MSKGFTYYIKRAQDAENRSVGLWKGMNQLIRSVLVTQRKKGKTLDETADILDEIAGPRKEGDDKRQGDMVSIENIRIAAKQIRGRKELKLI